MKKIFLFIVVVLFVFNYANAQMNVLLVLDNDYSTDEAANFQTAVENTSHVITVIDANQDSITAADLAGKDMVIWHTGGDGLGLHFWINDSTLTPNEAIMSYINAGGVFWLDGSEYLYTFYDNTYPNGQDYFENYSPGDFMYDYMGISSYVSETHANADPDGVSQLDKSVSNNINTLDPIMFKWATQWNADGYQITDNAVALYQFGPSGYVYAGDVNCLYNVHNNVTFITTASRTGFIGDGSAVDQNLINTFVEEIMDYAAANFVGVKEISNKQISIFPNPATDYITVSSDYDNFDVEISDITGRIILSKHVDNNSRINISNIPAGIYNVSIISDKQKSTSKIIVK